MCELSNMNRIWKEYNQKTNLQSRGQTHWYSSQAECPNNLAWSHLQDGVWHFQSTHVLDTTLLWSAICFKIMTRYICGFFPCILAIIPATRYTCVFCHVYLRFFLLCGVFIPKYMTIFLQTRIYMRTKKPIYMRYKQACGIWSSQKVVV